MKRSPIRRVTPLRTTKLGTRPVQPSKPVAGSRRPQRRDTGPTARVRALVTARSGGCCEVCGVLLRSGAAVSVHHRLPRRMGGTTNPAVNGAANLVLVCGSGMTGCHGQIESQRATAYLMGLLLRDGQHPASEPFQSVTGWWYVGDDGSKVPA